MELRHLDTLLAIDEEGSFTAAADALATVQSNVSDQVRQLEAELGVPLLVRSRRGAEPTEFGLLVLDRARRVHRELEAMRSNATTHKVIRVRESDERMFGAYRDKYIVLKEFWGRVRFDVEGSRWVFDQDVADQAVERFRDTARRIQAEIDFQNSEK